eukprot:scaffold35107_cov28-Tisochrysis_lutea.AAC.12
MGGGGGLAADETDGLAALIAVTADLVAEGEQGWGACALSALFSHQADFSSPLGSLSHHWSLPLLDGFLSSLVSRRLSPFAQRARAQREEVEYIRVELSVMLVVEEGLFDWGESAGAWHRAPPTALLPISSRFFTKHLVSLPLSLRVSSLRATSLPLLSASPPSPQQLRHLDSQPSPPPSLPLSSPSPRPPPSTRGDGMGAESDGGARAAPRRARGALRPFTGQQHHDAQPDTASDGRGSEGWDGLGEAEE